MIFLCLFLSVAKLSRTFLSDVMHSAECYLRDNESLKDASLKLKEKWSIEMRKGEAGKQILEKLDDKVKFKR